MSDDRSDGEGSETNADVIDLASRGHFRPDVGKLACRRLASARQRLGWTRAQLAAALDEVVGWKVSAEVIESWETEAVPPGDVLIAVDLLVQRGVTDPPSESSGSVGVNVLDELISERFGDLAEIYPSRAAFSSVLPPHALFDRATHISIAGLSLNLVCQQYSGQRLRRLIEGGSRMRCLFLAPHGRSITTREQEEGYPPGHLSELTEVNIRILERLRALLDQDAQQRLGLATYDEPIRFQIVLVDDQLGIVQPYLPGVRGVDSPTFLLRRLPGREGLLPAFQQAFSWLSDRSSPVC